MNSKGNMVLETISGLLVIAILALFYFGMDNVQYSLNEEFQNETSLTNYSKEIFQQNTDQHADIADYAILTIFIIVWLAAMASAWFSDEHPIFLVLTIILMVVVIAGAAFAQAGIKEVIEDGEFSTQYGRLPITVWLINNMLIVLTVMGLTVGLTLYLRFTK